jgi:rRNA maturation protein Rpf1
MMAEGSGDEYAARGKKTIDSLAKDARRNGDTRIQIVEERDGEAAIIATIDIDEMGGWAWAGEAPLKGKGGRA